MAERQQADYWIDFGDDGAPRAVRDRAQWHETRRQRVIASILLELHLMAATGIIPKSARGFTLIKARWQDALGAEDKETQLANCAPRQLVIHSREPQELLRKILPDRSDFLRRNFNKTDTLPTSFNTSDSLCENKGLVDGFRIACVAVIASGHETVGELNLDRVSVQVKNAFDLYKSKAKDVFFTCTSILGEKLTFPKPLPDNERKWKEQLLIIQNYAQTLRYTNAVNSISELGELENLIKIYKKVGENGQS